MDTSQTFPLCGFVILAAGQSARFGAAKQVVLFQGRPLLTHAIDTALRVAQGAAPIRIVTGAHRQAVEETVMPLLQRHANLALCHNPAWSLGLASSLRIGLRSLERVVPTVEAAIVMLGDQPLVTAQSVAALRERWRAGWEMAAPARADRRLGVPALFARTWWPALERLQGDRGARQLLERHRSQVGLVEAAADCLIDIDTPEDLAGWESMTAARRPGRAD